MLGILHGKKWGIKVSRPLMYNFTGKPYIDARLSFYSFIPKDISSMTSKKNSRSLVKNFNIETVLA